MALHGAVDDADGTFLALFFRPTEDLHGYAAIFDQVFRSHGLPLALYGDRTGILVRNDDRWTLQEELAGQQTPTQLGRLLKELGIRYIKARSPQAKGRIENRWGTLQDRLISELRLRNIRTLEAANAFLPEFMADFNRRFARSPREAAGSWRKPPRSLDLLMGCRYLRRVARDNTVTLSDRWIQIPPGPGGRSYSGCFVELRELLDGRLLAFYKEQLVASQPAPAGSFELKPRGGYYGNDKKRCLKSLERPPATPVSGIKSKPRKNRNARPSAKHPWRTAFTTNPQDP